MTNENTQRKQIAPHLIEYLNASGLPYTEPALTVCPHCGSQADILMGVMWSCPACTRAGDVVDYVMAHAHMDTPAEATQSICRTLHIRRTELDAISADELMDRQFPSRPMLIDQLIGPGVYLLAGASKIGKSWLVLGLAHQISCGEPVWGFQTRQCGVLYITLEDTFARVQQRLVEVCGGETGHIWITTESELIGEGLELQVTNFLREHPEVGLIIIDTLQRARPLDANRNSYADDYDVIAHLKALADTNDVTVLVVHHTRKAGAVDPFDLISGTTGLSGGVDGSLVLCKKSRQDDLATLYATGRDIQDLELELKFQRANKQWILLRCCQDPKLVAQNALLSAVCDYINEVGSYHGTATQLLAELSARYELSVNAPNVLTRMLNPLTGVLEHDYGIRYYMDRTSAVKTIYLDRIAHHDDDNDDNDGTVTISPMP